MSEVYVSHLASALGSRRESLEGAEARGRLRSPAAALRDAGFSHHHVCMDDEDAYALARRCFAATGIDPARVGCIVYANCLPQNANVMPEAQFAASRDVKHLMDFPASRLQCEFGMARAFVVGLSQQACTGMLGSVRLARNALCAGDDLEAVLCITADRFPPGALYEQAYNFVSDGAAACLVSRTRGGFRYLASHHLTNGALASATDDQTVGSYFTHVHEVVHATLARAGLTLAEIDWIVPQNINRKAWEVLGRVLGVSAGRTFVGSLAEHGHVISADNVINLAALAASGRLARGHRVLTFMAGYGSNWQCLALECA